MDITRATPRRKLRPFCEVVGHIRDKGRKTRKLTNDKSNDEYFVITLSKNLSYDEKLRRLFRLSEKVAAIEGRDVTCMAV
jgi:hypothetical protein